MTYLSAIFPTILLALGTVFFFGLCVLFASSNDDRDHRYAPFLAAAGLLTLIFYGIMASYTRIGAVANDTYLDQDQIYVTRSSVDLGNGSYAVVLESAENELITIRVSEMPPQLFKVDGVGQFRKFRPLVKPVPQPENPPK